MTDPNRATGTSGPDLDSWSEVLPDDGEDAIRLDDAGDLVFLASIAFLLLVAGVVIIARAWP